MYSNKMKMNKLSCTWYWYVIELSTALSATCCKTYYTRVRKDVVPCKNKIVVRNHV